ncbi:hypothetical protein MHBO_004276 [Bonamia ostreae]|uniref:Uncharacterized protein n=1 Tax=Bonamia ostreae TaxID=126728 RepID=A0ABV2ATD9_9EUKA
MPGIINRTNLHKIHLDLGDWYYQTMMIQSANRFHQPSLLPILYLVVYHNHKIVWMTYLVLVSVMRHK